MSLLAAAGDPEIPVAGVVIIASPFDFRRVRLIAPLRPVDDLLGGQLVRPPTGCWAGRTDGPVRLPGRRTRKQILKPWAIVSDLDDRDFLAQIEAVDAFMARMHAYPGRTF
ncbi:MAG: alpha/beta hydrolase, partial [Solirubrobacterales bacterium]